MNRSVLLIIVILVLNSCLSTPSKCDLTGTIIEINPQQKDIPHYDSLVRSIEYIPLEAANQSLITEIVEIVFTNNKIYISDNRERVLCFDLNGKYLYQLGRKGRGPGEYSDCFSISESEGVLYVYDNGRSTLHLYDSNTGGYVKSIRLKRPFVQTVILDDYIYGLDIVNGVSLYSIPLDKTDAQPRQLYTSAQKEFTLSRFRQIFKSDKCVWIDPLRGCVYELANCDMTLLFDLDFGNDETSQSQLLDGKAPIRNQVSHISNCYIAGEWCYISFAFDGDIHFALCDLRSGEVMNVAMINYLQKTQHNRQQWQHFPNIVACDGVAFYSLASNLAVNSDYDSLPAKYKTYARLANVNWEDANPSIVRIEFGK